MNIDSIQNGIVIDHITAGRGMKLYELLGLEKLDCSVAIIKNVHSVKLGKKDIIKVGELIDLNLDILGFISPSITINYIRNGERVKKRHPNLPEQIVNMIRCKNPRCITSIEQELPHIFYLADPEKEIYRCKYCDEKNSEKM